MWVCDCCLSQGRGESVFSEWGGGVGAGGGWRGVKKCFVLKNKNFFVLPGGIYCGLIGPKFRWEDLFCRNFGAIVKFVLWDKIDGNQF